MHLVIRHSFPCLICELVCTKLEYPNRHMQDPSKEEHELNLLKGQRNKCDQCHFETNCIKKFITHLLEAHRNKHASHKCFL